MSAPPAGFGRAAAAAVARLPSLLARLAPGLALCLAIAVASVLLQGLETRLFGRPWLEAIVLAILLGAALRSVWTPGPLWAPGVQAGARTLLEVAVVLLGATVSARAVLGVGPVLLAGIAGVVALGLLASFVIGRLAGLPPRMALLIACGNAICGNSAIAAVAPVIGAGGRDVASAIAFTAVLGVGVVLGLPLLAVALDMTPEAFGVFAGLTVYAVPQVLAATAPVSSLSAQVGTLVKLVRVLMLGPVVLVLSLLASRLPDDPDRPAAVALAGGRDRPTARHLAPWFIIGFLVMLAARSVDLIPAVALEPIALAATWLTIISMAGLGLGVDVRTVARAGPRVTTVVVLSLLVLGALALLLLRLAGLW